MRGIVPTVSGSKCRPRVERLAGSPPDGALSRLRKPIGSINPNAVVGTRERGGGGYLDQRHIPPCVAVAEGEGAAVAVGEAVGVSL